MTVNKTQKTKASVADFLTSVDDPQKRADCRELGKMMRAATGKNAKMWGSSLVGYGTYDYKYASGHEGSWFQAGFSPRAQSLVVYIMSGFSGEPSLMKKLGKYKIGKSCLYIKKLDDIDRKALQTLIERSVKYIRKNYHTY